MGPTSRWFTPPCAGCSIQDELFGSFEQLLSLADSKGATYDRSAAPLDRRSNPGLPAAACMPACRHALAVMFQDLTLNLLYDEQHGLTHSRTRRTRRQAPSHPFTSRAEPPL